MKILRCILNDSPPLDISCDNIDLHRVMNLLESHHRITRYTITDSKESVYQNKVAYYYSGYPVSMCAGKLVDKLFD